MVPSPARVGREDIADLAVAAAMFESSNSETDTREPFHYTLGVRWVSEEMAPFPPQGRKNDGLADAGLALKRALNTIYKSEERSKRRERLVAAKKSKRKTNVQTNLIRRLANQLQRRKSRLQPHGICVAVPVYIFLALFVKAMIYPLVQYLPGGQSLMVPAIRHLNEWMIEMFRFLIQCAMQYLLLPLARRQSYIPF
jgi:hypothetical protein